MTRLGKVENFNGRFGVIKTETEEFDFHVSDISNKDNTLHDGDNVEFRPESRPYHIKRAKNIIKVLRKEPTSTKN